MFNLFTSNRLESLAIKFCDLMQQQTQAVFATESIVVENSGMARWLAVQIAEQTGISANLEIDFPAEFMWKLLRLVSRDASISNETSPPQLRFHLMEELCENPQRYPELTHYILKPVKANKLDETKTWELANQLAQLLDQYLFYRSHWIQAWETPGFDSKDNWQARLWQHCVKDKGLLHWLALQDNFKSDFKQLDSSTLPPRISLFSMSALSPGYLDLLGELGTKTEVNFYVINPSESTYWGDIVSQKSKAKHSQVEQSYLENANPLLALMGTQGRDFILKLHDIAGLHESLTLTSIGHSPNQSLLRKLQDDISNFALPEANCIENDDSISFQSCHRAMRELEILHDRLLAEFEADSELKTSDIIVMVPDIDTYAPYIEAVFASSSQELPYSIADKSARHNLQLLDVISNVFSLAEKQYSAEAILEILDYADVRDKFNLSETDVMQCREILRECNLRWGIDAKQRSRAGLPDTEEHTWKYTLDRILLGALIDDAVDVSPLYHSARDGLDLLPFQQIEGSQTLLVSRLKQFTDCIFGVYDWQQQALDITSWIDELTAFIRHLSIDSTEQQSVLTAINELRDQAIASGFDLKINYRLFTKMILQCLEAISPREKFLGQGITFCALVPMRSVPFKIVCLLGMNEGEYPRQDKHHSFDLMATLRLRGDRSRRNEDRYLFLECILAARNKLIISYIGQSIKDNSDLPPSVLVGELLDVVETYTGVEHDELICKHPLQAFCPKYFHEEPACLFSYNHAYSDLQSKDRKTDYAFIENELTTVDDSLKSIHLNDFIDFYCSPARAYLRQRFAIHSYDEAINLQVREPFQLEAFTDKTLRSLILEETNNADQTEFVEALARGKGLLPYGVPGKSVLQSEIELSNGFQNLLPELTPLQDLAFDNTYRLEQGEFRLYGKLDLLTDSGRVVVKMAKPYAADYLEIWIKHLLLNVEIGNVNNNALDSKTRPISYLYSPEESFELKTLEQPELQLTKLLQLYWQGLHTPLHFFPKTSLALYAKDKNGRVNETNARNKWHGSNGYAGEGEQYENYLLHPAIDFENRTTIEKFLQQSELIFGSMFKHYQAL